MIVSGGVSRSVCSPAVPTTRPCSSAASTTGPAGRSSSTASSRPSPRTSPSGARPAESCATIARTWASSVVVDRVDDGARRGARDGVAAEGRGVVAGHEAGRRLVGDEQRADRQAVREPLRERDRVGPHAVRLPGEELAGAADAGLHLVEDEQRAVLVGERARLLERLGRERLHAALALHGLEEDRGRVAGRRARRASRASRSARPARAARTAARFAGWPVIESAPIVRPWNEPSSATSSLRPVDLRAHLIAASTDSVPELQKNACAPPNRSESFVASSLIGSVE